MSAIINNNEAININSFINEDQKNMKTHNRLCKLYNNFYEFNDYLESNIKRINSSIKNTIEEIEALKNIEVSSSFYVTYNLLGFFRNRDINILRKRINSFRTEHNNKGVYHIIDVFTSNVIELVNTIKKAYKLKYEYQCYYNLTNEEYNERMNAPGFDHHIINTQTQYTNIIDSYIYSNYKFNDLSNCDPSIEQEDIVLYLSEYGQLNLDD